MSSRTQTLEWLNARIDELERELELARQVIDSLGRFEAIADVKENCLYGRDSLLKE